MQFFIKMVVSALIIAIVSEVGKRYSWIAGIIASLPMISILSFLWLYIETKDMEKVVALSRSILWAVFPSLIFFVALPLFIRLTQDFYISMALAIGVMIVTYLLYIYLLGLAGIKV